MKSEKHESVPLCALALLPPLIFSFIYPQVFIKALNFAGGVLARGLFAPLLMFFLGPQLIGTFYGPGVAAADVNWADMVTNVWKFIIRPIGVGGMLLIPGGTFWMGCNSAKDAFCTVDEVPQHKVTLSPFYIDATEVTAGR